MRTARIPGYVAFVLLCGMAHSQSGPAQPQVRTVKNPFARMVVLPLEFDTASPIGENRRAQSVISFQPLVPFLLGRRLDLITQTTIPVIAQPNLAAPSGRKWGLGDITSNWYFSPDSQGFVQWGAGPALLFPTATDQALGTGKWAAGPAGGLSCERGNWTLVVAASDLRSFAGDRNRPDVHFMTLQYNATYSLPRGWYVTSAPSAAADWTMPAGERWLTPFGIGMGRVMGAGKQQFSFELSAYYSVFHPRTQPYPKWLFGLQFSIAELEHP